MVWDRQPMLLRRAVLLDGDGYQRARRGSGPSVCFLRRRFSFVLWGVTCGTKIAGGIDGMTGIGPGVVMTTVPPGTVSGDGKAVPDVIIITTVDAKQILRAMSSVATMWKAAPSQHYASVSSGDAVAFLVAVPGGPGRPTVKGGPGSGPIGDVPATAPVVSDKEAREVVAKSQGLPGGTAEVAADAEGTDKGGLPVTYVTSL